MNPPPASRMRLKSRLWPAVIALLLILEVLRPYRGWAILLIGLGLTWIAGWFWSRSLVRHLHLVREMRYGWATVGDLLEERFVVRNPGFLPAIWLEIADQSTIPGYNVARATGVESEGTNSWLTHQSCTRRGLFRLGPTSLLTGDPFGIYSVSILDDSSSTILVTPPVLPLPSIEVAAGGRAGEGRPARRAVEQTVVSIGVREYHPGDPVRNTHWPTTARRGETFIRTFANLPSGDWWIILDLNQDAIQETGGEAIEEAAVILAASLADRGLRGGTPVGLIANAEPLGWLAPRLGEGQRWEILKALALAQPASQRLAGMLECETGLLRTQSSLVLITPDLSGEWLDGLLGLTWRGVVPTVILVDPQSAQPDAPSAGLETVLENLGVAHYAVSPESLDRQAYPEAQNRFEWRTLATGRVIPVHRPVDMGWKALA